MITGHIHIDGAATDTKSKASFTYYSQMWWEKYFGIYNKDKYGSLMHTIYFSSNGLNVSSVILKDKENSFQCLTLNHCENKDPNRGKQNDGSNCDIWVLMEMFNRKKYYKNAIDSHTQSQWTKLSVKMFQSLIKMYELITEENNWLFEWKYNSAIKDKAKWMQIFSSSVDSEFNFNKRWDTMPKVTSTTNEELVHNNLKPSSKNTTHSKYNFKEEFKKYLQEKVVWR